MNKLEYLFTALGEEASEIILAKERILRLGLGGSCAGVGKTNSEVLVKEINEFMAIVEMLREEYDIPIVLSPESMDRKKKSIKEFIRISEELGIIKDE